jgi:RNA-directed DNA polymerase
MQSKLATWSTENKERKFDRLLRLVADRAWLSEAARITLASSGAKTPGVDGVAKVQMNSRRSVLSCWRGRTTRCQLDAY